MESLSVSIPPTPPPTVTVVQTTGLPQTPQSSSAQGSQSAQGSTTSAGSPGTSTETATISAQSSETSTQSSAVTTESSSQSSTTQTHVGVQFTLDENNNPKISAESLKQTSNELQQKLESLVKLSSNPNVDSAVDQILSSLKDVAGKIFKSPTPSREEGENQETTLNVQVDSNSFQTKARNTLQNIFNLASKLVDSQSNNSITPDDGVCLPGDRAKEEMSVAMEMQRLRARLIAEESYIQDLFTCPPQPFHSRLSVMGEMFLDD